MVREARWQERKVSYSCCIMDRKLVAFNLFSPFI